MSGRDSLGDFEQMALLAVLRLGESAYGVTILQELQDRAGRHVARGALYVTLERLESKRLLQSQFADPTPERGGRAKRYFAVTEAGLEALRASREALMRMWAGLEPVLEKP